MTYAGFLSRIRWGQQERMLDCLGEVVHPPVVELENGLIHFQGFSERRGSSRADIIAP